MGQKTVTFYCYLNTDETIVSPEVAVKIKDHMVAAFYRIKSEQPHEFTAKNAIKPPGSSHINPTGRPIIDPVHHIQGMYREGDKFYFAGSTGWVPAYILVMEGNEEKGFTKSRLLSVCLYSNAFSFI